jgi:hypothetical protein
MNAETPEKLLAYCRGNSRVCPQPRRWNELWEMLPNKVQVGAGWKPPLPLILTAWHHTSNLEKMMRLSDHIAWAHEHGVFEKVDSFLRGLPENEWHHLHD